MTLSSIAKTWDEAARQHGLVPILLASLIAINAAFAYMAFREIPRHLQMIEEGYEKNASQLDKAADRFANAAMSILSEYKKDRLADQHLMVELIRRGNVNSETVAEAMEAAAEKSRPEAKPPNGSG